VGVSTNTPGVWTGPALLENPAPRLRRKTLLMDADFSRSTRGVGIFLLPTLRPTERWQNMNQQSYTIAEFCEAERISRSQLYNLWNSGEGPDFYYAGHHRRITEAQRKDWHDRNSVESEGGAR
jgi:hypothetical protein